MDSNTPADTSTDTSTDTGAGTGAASGVTTLPSGIEIFKPGVQIDDSGRSHTFTPEMLAQMVASYNPAQHEAPLTIGHPKDNLPAYGWVKALYINDAGNLAIDPAQTDPTFADMVSKGRFKKRSASFYPPDHPSNPTPGKWHLRHVAFLGAQPPAVKGLKQFSDGTDAAGWVSFSETTPTPTPQETPDMTPEQTKAMQDELAAAKAEKAALEAKVAQAEADAEKAQAEVRDYAERAAQNRVAQIVGFAQAQEKAGKLLPKDKPLAVAALDIIGQAQQPYDFSEGKHSSSHSPADVQTWLQNLIANGKQQVEFGEMASGRAGAAGFDARGKSDEEIDRAAQQYLRENKDCSYGEAVRAVTTNFSH